MRKIRHIFISLSLVGLILCAALVGLAPLKRQTVQADAGGSIGSFAEYTSFANININGYVQDENNLASYSFVPPSGQSSDYQDHHRVRYFAPMTLLQMTTGDNKVTIPSAAHALYSFTPQNGSAYLYQDTDNFVSASIATINDQNGTGNMAQQVLKVEAKNYTSVPQNIIVHVHSGSTTYKVRLVMTISNDITSVVKEIGGNDRIKDNHLLVQGAAMTIVDGERTRFTLDTIFRNATTNAVNPLKTISDPGESETVAELRTIVANTGGLMLIPDETGLARVNNVGIVSGSISAIVTTAVNDSQGINPPDSAINTEVRGLFFTLKVSSPNAFSETNYLYFSLKTSVANNLRVYVPITVVQSRVPTQVLNSVSLKFNNGEAQPIDLCLVENDVTEETDQFLLSFLTKDSTQALQYSTTDNAYKSSNERVVSVTRISRGSDKYVIRLTPVENGTAYVSVDVNYGTGTQTYSVAVTVSGRYTISMATVAGKRARTFNVMTDSAFREIIRDGFILISAESLTTEFFLADLNNDILTITPKAYSNNAAIQFQFQDRRTGEIVSIRAKLIIDYNANNITTMFEDWQLILMLFGLILVLALIIGIVARVIIGSLSRKKQDELAVTAPTSSYLIKFNATLAAQQQQAKLAAQQFATLQQNQMLALSAGHSSTGQQPPLSLNHYTGPTVMQPPPSMFTPDIEPHNFFNPPPPPMMDPIASAPPPPPPPPEPQEVDNSLERVVLPITDEQLLERIFVEKFEPRGMKRKSFFKAKDLQTKELEKEKERIYAEIKSGVSIEEACKSQKQRLGIEDEPKQESVSPVVEEQIEFEQEEPTFAPPPPARDSKEKQEKQKKAAAIFDEEFGADRIEYEEEESEQTTEGTLAENTKTLKSKESNVASLSKKIENQEVELMKLNDYCKSLDERIVKLHQTINTEENAIVDLQIKVASAKGKERDKLAKELAAKEDAVNAAKDSIASAEKEKDAKSSEAEKLNASISKNKNTVESDRAVILAIEQENEKLKKEIQETEERLRKEREMAERKQKMDELSPILVQPNKLDFQISKLTDFIEQSTKEKVSLKSEASALQSQLLLTTNSAQITQMSEDINAMNKKISDLDREITKANKSKSERTIELTGLRRKINDHIESKNIEFEDVVTAEDLVIADIAFEEFVAKYIQEKADIETKLNDAIAKLDQLRSNSDQQIANSAISVAANIKKVEDELQGYQDEYSLNELTIDDAPEDDKLLISIQQAELQDKIDECTKRLETARAEGIKTNMETKMRLEQEQEESSKLVEELQEAHESAVASLARAEAMADKRDLITSGSGIISRDRQKIEQENLRKQLNESKNAIEQANLRAKVAQMEAERAFIEAQKASEASREEAKRLADEAIKVAEEAKLEAERKAQEMQQEAEQKAKMAEESRLEAERKAEEIRLEAERKAEEMRLENEQKLSEARMEAEQMAEQARMDAERMVKEAEEARLLAEKAKAEEEAKRLEEERKQKEEQEKALEEERKQKEAARNEKISKRKMEIAELRSDIDSVKTQEQGKALSEKFFALLLSLDDEEKSSVELVEMINKGKDDAIHAGELAHYKDLANKQPQERKIYKKVTEKVNYKPRPASGGAGQQGIAARPQGAQAPRPGARPQGAQARPVGQRPQGAQARPVGQRPQGAPPPRPGARPQGAPPPRPQGARPQGAPPPRPQGSPPRPQGAPPKPRA